jgi:hypothetical protein
MDLSRTKYLRGKIVPHMDLQAGTGMGDPRLKDDCNKVNVLQ